MEELNWIAIAAATVASFAFGALWYSPIAFLKPWAAASGVNPEESISNPAMVYGSTFIFTLITAVVLALIVGPAPDLASTLGTAALLGVGLVLPSQGINYLFMGRPLQWLIDALFHVARLLIMGVVIALIG